MTSTQFEPVHLRAGGTSVLIEIPGKGTPAIAYWGADLGDVDPDEVRAVIAANRPQHRVGDVDEPVPVSLVPVASEGWTATPGLEGHRMRSAFAPALRVVSVDVQRDDDGARIVATCVDDDAMLTLALTVEVLPSGLLRQRHVVRNEGSDGYEVHALRTAFPIPDTAGEILDLTGRWARERVPQRSPLTVGRHTRESRKGRPGADATMLLVVGERGFGFERGRVHGIHVAWSGNHELVADRTILSGSVLMGSELLLPGEVVLEAQEEYRTPWVYASHGDGLDELAARFHAFARAIPGHRQHDRPVIINTWEAVYFDHDFEKLMALADLGAQVGAELYMLDDGWFLGRRDDRRALGDWEVDPEVWPNGLAPIIDHVRSLGLRFGIWVEPEMVNVDSRLAREHPEWILRPGRRMPPVGKWQHVLDLSNPEAYAYIHERLDALLAHHDIDYLKWDHNRDVLEPGSHTTAQARLHEHTLAVYRLFDELRAKHPHVEIENCASGGSRIDLEILARTDRTWVSDTTDPIERALVQQYTGLLVPLEMVGNDIATARSHSTDRTSWLDLRGGIALLGHLGIQWDLTTATPEELSGLTAWVAAYKRHRNLLHSGRAVSADHPDSSLLVRGVVAEDQAEAVFTLAQLTSGIAPSAGRIRFPGLDPDARYAVRVQTPGHAIRAYAYTPMPWVVDGAQLSGRMLSAIGLEAPVLNPEQVLLVTLTRV